MKLPQTVSDLNGSTSGCQMDKRVLSLECRSVVVSVDIGGMK